MLVIFIGASCSGKSTAAKRIAESVKIDVWTGKEYVRLGNSEPEAWRNFVDMLAKAAKNPELSRDSILYITDDPQRLDPHLQKFLHALKVKFIADLETLKERFRKRLQGKLPLPIELMLQRQIEKIEAAPADLEFDTMKIPSDEIAEAVLKWGEAVTLEFGVRGSEFACPAEACGQDDAEAEMGAKEEGSGL